MDSDSHTERRNLSALSFAIIVFYLAGGHIDLEQVRLGIFTTNFDRGYVITGAVWVALIWFAFRFWLTTKGDLDNEFLLNQLQINKSGRLVRWYTQKMFGSIQVIRPGMVHKQDDVDKTFVSIQNAHLAGKNQEKRYFFISFNAYKLNAIRNNGSGIDADNIGVRQLRGVKNLNGNRLIIRGFRGLILKALTVISHAHKDTGFSQIVVPYTLFALALMCGVWGLIGSGLSCYI